MLNNDFVSVVISEFHPSQQMAQESGLDKCTDHFLKACKNIQKALSTFNGRPQPITDSTLVVSSFSAQC